MLDTKTDANNDPEANTETSVESGAHPGEQAEHHHPSSEDRAPREHGLRAADPANRTRRDVTPAGTVFAIMIATLLLAAGMNAETMLGQAEASELGRNRDVALAFWRPLERASSFIGLTLPRGGLDAFRDADRTGNPVSKTVAGSAKHVPAPSQDGREQVLGPTADPNGNLGPDSSGPSEPATTTSQTAAAPSSTEAATATDPTTPAPTTEGAGGTDPGVDGVNPLGPTPEPDPSQGDTGSPAPIEPGFAIRRPTAEEPLRILLIGDSTLDAVGTSVLRDLAQTGVTDGVLDFRVSSGLSRPDFFDWPGHLRQLRPQLDPEIVVIMIGANDAQPFIIDGKAEAFGTERWFETYRSRVRGLLDELTADGDWVVWIGQPAMRSQDFDTKMGQLNQLYSEEVANYPTAVFVDSRPVMADADGNYAAYLVDANGNRNQVRKTDGVHFTSAGGDHLSPTVVAAINEIAPLF